MRNGQICVQLCTENQWKGPTLVADLNNFPGFEYFQAIFTQDSSPPFLYHDAKKKSQVKGGIYCLILTKTSVNNDIGPL